MKKTLEIQNLKCGGCGATILKKLSTDKSIRQVSVDVENSTVSLDYNTSETINRVEKTLAKMGYPLVGKQNSLGRKAKSYVSCAFGRMAK